MQAIIAGVIRQVLVALAGWIFGLIMKAYELAKRKEISKKIEEARQLSNDPATSLEGNKLSEDVFKSFT